MNRKHAAVVFGLAVTGCGSIAADAENSESSKSQTAQGAVVTAEQQTPVVAAEARWEYHVVGYNSDYPRLFDESATKLGQDGWELVNCIPTRIEFTFPVCFFKRPSRPAQ